MQHFFRVLFHQREHPVIEKMRSSGKKDSTMTFRARFLPVFRGLTTTLGTILILALALLYLSRTTGHSVAAPRTKITVQQEADLFLATLYPHRHFRVVWDVGETSWPLNAPGTYRQHWYKSGHAIPLEEPAFAPFTIECPVDDSPLTACRFPRIH